MTKYSIELPESIFIRNIGGEAFSVRPSEFEAVLSRITETGLKVLLTNVYNGGGKDASDVEKLAALNKKLDSWKRGEFNVVDRGESFYTGWRSTFVADCIAAGFSDKQADSIIRDKVKARLPEGTKATFANYLEATALEMAEGGDVTRDAALEALEGYYAAETAKREAEAAKKAAKLEAPKLDLSAFLKNK